MSSPAPSDADAPKDQEQITFRFCRECSNMLYPKEDRENNVLMYACRTCQFSEQAPTACVYRNQLSNTVGETAGVTQDVGSDPTVGDPFSYASVQEPRSPASSGDGSSEADSAELIICTLCGHEIACYHCGGLDGELMAVHDGTAN